MDTDQQTVPWGIARECVDILRANDGDGHIAFSEAGRTAAMAYIAGAEVSGMAPLKCVPIYNCQMRAVVFIHVDGTTAQVTGRSRDWEREWIADRTAR